MAVYTELSFDEIQAHGRLYDLAPLVAADGIRAGVENTNYRLVLADGTRLILTLFEKRTNEADLPFFMALMEHLATQHIPCPLPLHAKDGTIIQRIKSKSATLVTFLEGKSVAAITPAHLAELGQYLAKMHHATQNAVLPTRLNALSLAGWKALAVHIAPKVDTIAAGLAQGISQELEVLEMRWPKDLPHGIIHADLFPDNVFFDAENRLSGLIDFYFACEDMFAYDLAICLNAWCFESDYSFNITKAQQLLKSYHAVRPLSVQEIDALPLLARGSALRFMLTRAEAMLFPAEGALVTQKNPLEYYAKLRFHQRVKDTKEYGLG